MGDKIQQNNLLFVFILFRHLQTRYHPGSVSSISLFYRILLPHNLCHMAIGHLYLILLHLYYTSLSRSFSLAFTWDRRMSSVVMPIPPESGGLHMRVAQIKDKSRNRGLAVTKFLKHISWSIFGTSKSSPKRKFGNYLIA